MKKLYLGVAAAGIASVAWGYANGPDARYTAAPGDSALACASAGCHTSSRSGGPLNSYGGSVAASFSGATSYTPGKPIAITVTVSDPSNRQYGFQMTARLESNLAQAQAGTFTPSSGQLVICDNNSTRRGTSCPATSPVEFIEHSTPGRSSFSFTWTAPQAGSGPVHFYVAGNAVNGNGQADGGDHVYTATYVLTEASAGGTTVTSAISAGAYGAIAAFASGSWLEIYGSNLATNTRSWTGADFNGLNAPTQLDGTKVTINGKPAFVGFISPTQVNVQAPADASSVGMVQVALTSPSGQTATVMAQKSAAAPGLLAPGAFLVNGKQYVAATLPDFATFLGDPTVVAGTSRPAKPGETIILYGIGFGDAKDGSGNSIPPGTIVQTANQLASPLSISFGAIPAAIVYQGLAPNYVGLYYFYITVPNVPNGDQPINVSLGGQPISQSLFLTVHQ